MGYIVISGELITAVGVGRPDLTLAANVIDAGGRTLMPGAIDIHIHARQPGLTHKATIASESRAALAGGVTSWVDMPNTIPPTTTEADIAAKLDIAASDSVTNYGFYLGVTRDNLAVIPHMDYSRVAGLKLFIGSSTGGMLLDSDHDLAQLFETAPRDIVITVHAEDNAIIAANTARIRARYGDRPPIFTHSLIRSSDACVRATERVMTLADRYGARLNVAHVTTAAEMSLFAPGDIAQKRITCEVSPHHLLWCDDDYATRGSRIKMNPAVKTTADREALRQGVLEGRVDVIATDHAPHLPAEKQGSALDAASGAPMVQFALPAMLDMFGPEVVSRLFCDNPARLLGIEGRGRLAPGYKADIILVEESAPRPISDDDVISPCGWTPLAPDPSLAPDSAPFTLSHRVTATMVNGSLSDRGAAQPLTYHHSQMPI